MYECRICRSIVTTVHKRHTESNSIFHGREIEMCELCFTTHAGQSLKYLLVGAEDYGRREILTAILQVGNHLRELILARTTPRQEDFTPPPPWVDCPNEQACRTDPNPNCKNYKECGGK